MCGNLLYTKIGLLDDGYTISSYDDVTSVEIEQSSVLYIARLLTLILGILYGLLGFQEKNARCDDMEVVNMNEENQKKVVYKVGQWREKSGTRFCNAKTASWTQADPEIQEFISTGIVSPKTGNYEQFSLHTQIVMFNRDCLVNFYSPQKWRQLKWKK